ncbi:MAG: hypothetical protein IDH49_05260 [Gammaproteobacteria bacterium]|nr:hypothetical protein [Gammaproteobacteria bacterium]
MMIPALPAPTASALPRRAETGLRQVSETGPARAATQQSRHPGQPPVEHVVEGDVMGNSASFSKASRYSNEYTSGASGNAAHAQRAIAAYQSLSAMERGRTGAYRWIDDYA